MLQKKRSSVGDKVKQKFQAVVGILTEKLPTKDGTAKDGSAGENKKIIDSYTFAHVTKEICLGKIYNLPEEEKSSFGFEMQALSLCNDINIYRELAKSFIKTGKRISADSCSAAGFMSGVVKEVVDKVFVRAKDVSEKIAKSLSIYAGGFFVSDMFDNMFKKIHDMTGLKTSIFSGDSSDYEFDTAASKAMDFFEEMATIGIHTIILLNNIIQRFLIPRSRDAIFVCSIR